MRHRILFIRYLVRKKTKTPQRLLLTALRGFLPIFFL